MTRRLAAFWILFWLLCSATMPADLSEAEDVSLPESALFENCCYDAVYIALRCFGRTVAVTALADHCPGHVLQSGMTLDDMKALLDGVAVVHADVFGREGMIANCLGEGAVVIAPLAPLRWWGQSTSENPCRRSQEKGAINCAPTEGSASLATRGGGAPTGDSAG